MITSIESLDMAFRCELFQEKILVFFKVAIFHFLSYQHIYPPKKWPLSTCLSPLSSFPQRRKKSYRASLEDFFSQCKNQRSSLNSLLLAIIDLCVCLKGSKGVMRSRMEVMRTHSLTKMFFRTCWEHKRTAKTATQISRTSRMYYAPKI